MSNVNLLLQAFRQICEDRMADVFAELVLAEHTAALEAERTARMAAQAKRDELLAALKESDEFIDQIRQDIHHERIADWYPEGAHNSAEAMSESMRRIGNQIADFDAARAVIAKAEGGAA